MLMNQIGCRWQTLVCLSRLYGRFNCGILSSRSLVALSPAGQSCQKFGQKQLGRAVPNAALKLS